MHVRLPVPGRSQDKSPPYLNPESSVVRLRSVETEEEPGCFRGPSWWTGRYPTGSGDGTPSSVSVSKTGSRSSLVPVVVRPEL